MKQCQTCGAVFEPVSVRHSFCSARCRNDPARRREICRRSYAKNIERERARSRAKQAANPGAALRRVRRYQADHPERVKTAQAETYRRRVAKDPNYRQSSSLRARDWAKGHPEQRAAQASRRRALRAGADGSHTIEQWLSLCAQHERCLRCGADAPLTRDHIIPLTRGGSDFISNIQPLCRPCNSAKGNRSTTDYREAAA